MFEKHILSYGDLLYPSAKGGKVKIDDDFAHALIRNFNNGVAGIVQVPKADANNQHSEDPDRNVGEVVGLTARNDKIYAQIDARDADAAKRIKDKLILGASAFLHLNYPDTRTGEKVGPTLLHVCLTNRPYVVDLEDFSELIAATADGKSEAVILTATTKENSTMELDAMLAELREKHGINVPELQERAAAAETAVSLTSRIQEELGGAGFLKLSAGSTPSEDDLISAVVGAKDQIVSLTSQVTTMREESARKAAESRIDTEVRAGRILPKAKDAQVTLLLTNPDLFEQLLPEKPLVKLSASDGEEIGFEPVDEKHGKTVEAEIARLSQTAAAQQYIKSPAA